MYKLFKIDQFWEVYERFIQFQCYKNTVNVKMEDFILEFKKLYNRIRQKNMILPPAAIVLKLLDASQLDSNQKSVLTGADYNKVNTLFDQMKKVLRTFHRQQAIPPSSAPINIEAALETTSESVYYSKIKVQTTGDRNGTTFPELKWQQEISNQAAVV